MTFSTKSSSGNLLTGKGISDLLAALFIAELRDPSRFPRPRQIERMAGYHLHVCDSGTYKGRRRITHLGNSRLRRVLYQMVSETSKYVPEVRANYLRRHLAGHANRQKNLVVALPPLLALVIALMREGRTYEEHPERIEEVRRLEAEIERRKQPGGVRAAGATPRPEHATAYCSLPEGMIPRHGIPLLGHAPNRPTGTAMPVG